MFIIKISVKNTKMIRKYRNTFLWVIEVFKFSNSDGFTGNFFLQTNVQEGPCTIYLVFPKGHIFPKLIYFDYYLELGTRRIKDYSFLWRGWNIQLLYPGIEDLVFLPEYVELVVIF
jgi:hypothetical protein